MFARIWYYSALKRVENTRTGNGKLFMNPQLTENPSGTRAAAVRRHTRETQIELKLELDGNIHSLFDTGVPFLDHMLDQVARHGQLGIEIKARGDLQIDAHHTVEDIGITLGQAFAKVLGDCSGIQRYGYSYVPLDEALSRVVIDFSGRPMLVDSVEFPLATAAGFDYALLHEFFQGFCNHAHCTLHLDCIRGHNGHHIAETIFKAFGRALRMAVAVDPALAGAIPSTKGTLQDV